MPLPELDNDCGENFKFRDFVECSDTWIRTQEHNIPKQQDTYDAMGLLAETILDPIVFQFGGVNLTYGFSSPALVKLVKKAQ
jgi:hypothetical protein